MRVVLHRLAIRGAYDLAVVPLARHAEPLLARPVVRVDQL